MEKPAKGSGVVVGWGDEITVAVAVALGCAVGDGGAGVAVASGLGAVGATVVALGSTARAGPVVAVGANAIAVRITSGVGATTASVVQADRSVMLMISINRNVNREGVKEKCIIFISISSVKRSENIEMPAQRPNRGADGILSASSFSLNPPPTVGKQHRTSSVRSAPTKLSKIIGDDEWIIHNCLIFTRIKVGLYYLTPPPLLYDS